MKNQKKIISDYKQAQIDLKNALVNSGVSVAQQDLDLRYTQFVNTHPGMAQENLIGKTDEDWLPPDEAARLTKIKKRALEGKKGVREMFKSTLGAKSDSKVYYNDIRVEPILDGEKVVAIYTVSIDVTESQEALRKLEMLNGQLLKHLENILDADPGENERMVRS